MTKSSGSPSVACLPTRKTPARKKPVKPDWSHFSHQNFVAIDFETANRYRNSACAISLVKVENNVIVDTLTQLLRPPLLHFEFTYIHGITAKDVLGAPSYIEFHEKLLQFVEGAAFLAAHNASFDSSVLNALCRHWNLQAPGLSWQCTVKLARSTWGVYPTRLPDVCNHLNIGLKHHDATSDATACARIVLESRAHMQKSQIETERSPVQIVESPLPSLN